jgi:cytochrome c peroxidase
MDTGIDPLLKRAKQHRYVRALVTGGLLAACTGAGFAAPEEPVRPVPAALAVDPARVEIGRRLFRDTRLSANGRVSCASCHDVSKGGADSRPRSAGFAGRETAVNAPTVFNAALNFRQFWNGRADSLEAQVGLVVVDPVEMGSNWDDVVEKVARDAHYRRAFASAYRDGVTRANIENAIACYERTLITPDSRFDKFLRGERNALSAEEKAGYAKFKQYGCVSCHQGVNLGGNMFQKFGIMGDYFAMRGGVSEADLGRFNVTGDSADRHVFKVPGLRNVALTAPYFHDGRAQTLEDAVKVMFRYQLGRTPSAEDTAAIVKFLHTLTARPPGGSSN